MFNKNKTNKIIFKAFSEHSEFLTDMPKPASNIVPDWYKKEKNFSNGKNNFLDSLNSNVVGTYKLCVPLIDTMTSGYLITLPADIVVRNDGTNGNYVPMVTWLVDWEILDHLETNAALSYPTPQGFNKEIFRWSFDFQTITPDGYSCWITHPSHRWDLPFLTINGFVDTDKHPSDLRLPFFFKEGFVGVIPEGTPVAQLIPIKRENWKSEKGNLDPQWKFIKRNSNKIRFIRTYKDKYWSRKKYE
jgi:hypothetical protein